jgi:YD repeat-containing protein
MPDRLVKVAAAHEGRPVLGETGRPASPAGQEPARSWRPEAKVAMRTAISSAARATRPTLSMPLSPAAAHEQAILRSDGMPLVSVRAAMFSSAPSTPTSAFTTIIGSQNTGTDTGITVAISDVVRISASGLINFDDDGSLWYGPAGNTGIYYNGLPKWSLIGEIGSGPWFYVGAALTFQATSSGELYLMANDDRYDDNAGSFYANVNLNGGGVLGNAYRCAPCNGAQPAGSRNPFNSWTGNYYTSARDLEVNTPGAHLAWTRTYDSQATGDPGQPGNLGYGWQHTYSAHLLTSGMSGGEPGTVVVIAANGDWQRYAVTGTSAFQAYPGVYSTLVQNGDGSYTQTAADQSWLTFNSAGQLTAEGDGHGNSLSLTYTSGKLAQVTDDANAGRYLALDYYTGTSQLQDVRDPAGRSVQYAYSAAGDLQQVTDVMNRKTTYQYQNHLLIEIDDNLGGIVEHQTYDAYAPSGRLIGQTLQNGTVLTATYTLTGTTVLTAGPDGKQDTTILQYNPATNTLTGIDQDGVQVQQSQYDQNIAPGAMTDGNGNLTRETSNAFGEPLSVTNALTQTSAIQYDSMGRPLTATDTLGRQTALTYDAAGNLTQVTTGITTTSPLSQTTKYVYNVRYPGKNWLEDEISPQGVDTRYDYNSGGQLVDQTVGYGTGLAETTGYGYDSLGRVMTTTVGLNTPLARSDVTLYNPDNSIAETIQNDKTGTYNPLYPDQDVTTSYGYDGLGRQIWVRDTLGHYSVTHYNAQGQVDWTVKNLQPVQLDGQGNPILPATPPAYSPSQTDANVATLYGYDGLGRTQLVTQTGILTGTFNLANRTFSAATTRATRYDYDSLGRLATTTLNYVPGAGSGPGVNVVTQTKYDNQGNVTWQQDALGRWTETLYDALNRPYETIQNYENGNPTTVDPANQGWTDGHDTDIIHYTRYNPDGTTNQSIANYVNGLFTATQPITDTITQDQYDQLGRLTTTVQNYDPPTLGLRTDTNRTSTTQYDPVTGLAVGEQDPLGRWTSTLYDQLARADQTIQNCTDANGNPVATGCAAFDPAHPDRNVATTTGYDALGRPYQSIDALGHVTQTSYDGLGRTIAVTANCTDANGTPSLTGCAAYSAAHPDRNVTTKTGHDGLGRTVSTPVPPMSRTITSTYSLSH